MIPASVRTVTSLLLVSFTVTFVVLTLELTCNITSYTMMPQYNQTCMDVVSQPTVWSSAIMTLLPILLALLGMRIVRRKGYCLVVSILLSALYLLNGFFLLYFLHFTHPFDLFLVLDNGFAVWKTLIAIVPRVSYYVLGVPMLAMLLASGFYIILVLGNHVIHTIHLPRKLLIGSIIVGVLALAFVPEHKNNQIAWVIQRSISSSFVSRFYIDLYTERTNEHKQPFLLSPAALTEPSILIIQLESVNAYVADERTVPHLYRIARDGFLFPHVQSASVQTQRSQESILCSLIPSLYGHLINSESDLEQLKCLPRILRSAGYRTLYFQNYDLSFLDVGSFMHRIGFDETHSGDIMDTSDEYHAWGYDDYAFLKQALTYIRTQQDGPYFAYIAIGASNHYPFYNESLPLYAPYRNIVPHTDPQSHQHNYENSLAVQDHILGRIYDDILKPYIMSETDIWIIGDHSFPVGVQRTGNTDNLTQAWQETFLTEAVYIPAQSRYDIHRRGSHMTQFYSQLDFMPTILDLQQISYPSVDGVSMSPDIRHMLPASGRCLLSVQPYHNQYISLIIYPDKYLLNIAKNITTRFDLDLDPLEQKPLAHRKISESDLALISTCVKPEPHSTE